MSKPPDNPPLPPEAAAKIDPVVTENGHPIVDRDGKPIATDADDKARIPE